MRRLVPALAAVLLLTAAPGAGQSPATGTEVGNSILESYIELLRQQTGIPGISAALVQNGEVVWERGLGMANQETRVRATPDTPYLISDLSQTFAAALILRCAEMRRLDLDATASAHGVVLPEGDASLRQVLSHASTSSPNGFKYDPARYALLTRAVEGCEQQPYRRTLVRRIIDPLAMIDTVPGRDLQNASALPEGFFEPPALQRYAATLERLAVPYKVDGRRRATRTDLAVDGVNAATGIVSTVRDLARLDLAWENDTFLKPDTMAAAWSPAPGPAGTWLPTGLGWFVQSYRGMPVVWQFGVTPNAYSALVVKVPSRRVTLILLANSDGLTGPFQLEAGDVTRSLFAAMFLRLLL